MKKPTQRHLSFHGNNLPPLPLRGCQSDPTRAAQILLVGDSHADALAWKLRQALAQEELNLTSVTFSACAPVRGLRSLDNGSSRRCPEFNDTVLSYLESSSEQVVVLAARWRLYLEGGGYDNTEGGDEGGAFPVDVVAGAEGRSEAVRKTRVVKRYREGVRHYLDLGKKVILVYTIPEAGWNVPELLAKQKIWGAGTRDVTTSYEEFGKRNKTTFDAFDGVEHPNLFRVKPHEIFCDSQIKGRCVNSADGRVLYLDTNHVSNAGAELIDAEITKIARRLSQSN